MLISTLQIHSSAFRWAEGRFRASQDGSSTSLLCKGQTEVRAGGKGTAVISTECPSTHSCPTPSWQQQQQQQLCTPAAGAQPVPHSTPAANSWATAWRKGQQPLGSEQCHSSWTASGQKGWRVCAGSVPLRHRAPVPALPALTPTEKEHKHLLQPCLGVLCLLQGGKSTLHWNY